MGLRTSRPVDPSTQYTMVLIMVGRGKVGTRGTLVTGATEDW
jgi:hypothetical protein